ncbi:hypothetical protein PG997_000583 [Apiospora hydei]|uniref:Cytochrome P450 n=1 Tax=Apiospora hydei TaxID=1337664 RepID=A0ABR1XBC9_9PEZI
METIFQYIVCFVIALLAAVAGKRLFIHPLRAYPGPLLGRLTNGYAGWHAIKGDVHLMTYRDHLKYGKITARSNNDVLYIPERSHRKGPDLYLHPLPWRNAQRLHRTRQARPPPPTPGRGPSHLRALDALVRAHNAIPDRRIPHAALALLPPYPKPAPKQPQAVDMTPRCKYLATDIIAHLAFGHALATQTDEPLRLIPHAFARLNPAVYLFMNWPKTHALVDPAAQWLLRARAGAFRRALAGVVADRMALPRDARHDLYSLVATEERASIFLNAGGTTTGTAICSVFFYFSRYSAVYAQLANEIRTTFSSGSEIRQGPQLASCKYLRAVIDETLRICPPTPGVMWREKDPLSPEPLVVDGHVIPPGTLVGVGTYSLMHNPEYFPEPFSFRPQRWLDGAVEEEDPKAKEARAIMRRAFIPFSLGDRGCAGKAVAYSEMSLTVAKTLWYFDFEKAPGAAGDVGGGRKGAEKGRDRPDEYQLHDSFMADHNGPNLVFRARGDYWEDLAKTSE